MPVRPGSEVPLPGRADLHVPTPDGPGARAPLRHATSPEVIHAAGWAGDANDVACLRRGYRAGHLSEEDLAPTWLEQFAAWFADASTPGVGVPEPNAMVFATADAQGRPSARTVLLKGFGETGFVLYTNYTSRKSRDTAENPHCSLVFPWYALERQVVVAGSAERLPSAESAAYFRSRPRGSQIGAWASRQSTVISSRTVLEDRRALLEHRWPEPAEIPAPPFWGGLRVVPDTVEFWQGRPDRLHDRLRYRRLPATAGAGQAGWVIERLAP